MYTPELAARVHRLYARDFATFGYDVDSWRGSLSPDDACLQQRQVLQRQRGGAFRGSHGDVPRQSSAPGAASGTSASSSSRE